MRIFVLVISLTAVLFTASCAPQQSPPEAQKQAAQPAPPAGQVHGNLGQVMRGIIFPNSNVIFAAQGDDPAKIKPAKDPATSTDPLTSAYGGWTAVENAGIALAEGANLLTIPGRKCSNGLDVPMNNPDWAGLVQGLRDAGMTAYKAGQSKNQDNVLMAADVMTTACANCHDKYRDKPGGDAARCK